MFDDTLNEETANDHRTGQRRALKPGEWACVDAKCANINSEKRTTCESSKPRAKSRIGREIGKEAADKSKGLFSAEDWVCTKCGNVNWARRSTCNICNAPKLGDLEVRTGYGGGFMDREDVEYIERNFDEEFDEFGRKKKRRKFSDEDRLNLDDRQGEEEDNEETDDVDIGKYKLDEDEGEDEGDDDELDKYDLTADPEIAGIKIDISKFKKETADMERRIRANSIASSDCSCSCSGGECTCEESDSEDLKKIKSKKEEKISQSIHEHEHSKERHRDKSKYDDRKERDRHSRERDRDKNGRSKSHDRDRSKDRRRSRERDYKR